jgi:hypothetical protein
VRKVVARPPRAYRDAGFDQLLTRPVQIPAPGDQEGGNRGNSSFFIRFYLLLLMDQVNGGISGNPEMSDQNEDRAP